MLPSGGLETATVDTLASYLRNVAGFRTEIIRNPKRAEIVQKITGLKSESASPLLVYFFGKGAYLSNTNELFYLPSDARPQDEYQESYWSVQTLLKALDAASARQIAVFFDLDCPGWNPKPARYDQKIANINKGRVQASSTDPGMPARLYFAAPAQTGRPWGLFWREVFQRHGRFKETFGLSEVIAGGITYNLPVQFQPFGNHQTPADVILPLGAPSQFKWYTADSLSTRWFLPRQAGDKDWYTNGIFIDARDAEVYRYIEIDSLCWMIDDLRFQGLKGSRWYEETAGKPDYGHMLYSYNAATYACPAGWRLPQYSELKLIARKNSRTLPPILFYYNAFEDPSNYFSGNYDSESSSMRKDFRIAVYWLADPVANNPDQNSVLVIQKDGMRLAFNEIRWRPDSDLYPCRCVRSVPSFNQRRTAVVEVMHPNEKSGYVIDPRDGSIYSVVRWKQKLWMTQELRFPQTGALGGMEDLERPWNTIIYYDQAGALRACAGLGEGWHLPSSDEWEEMMNELGGFFDVEKQEEHGSATKGYSDFGNKNSDLFQFRNIIPYNRQGIRDQSFKEYLFWSSESLPDGTAWAYGSSDPFRKTIKKRLDSQFKLPCRCLRD